MSVKFNDIHLNELMTLDTDVDILTTYSYAMIEGSADLIASNVGLPSEYIARTLDTVSHYCTTRNISFDILHEDNMFVLYLY